MDTNPQGAQTAPASPIEALEPREPDVFVICALKPHAAGWGPAHVLGSRVVVKHGPESKKASLLDSSAILWIAQRLAGQDPAFARALAQIAQAALPPTAEPSGSGDTW